MIDPGTRGPDDLVRAAVAAGVRDARVLDAFKRVRREHFVPHEGQDLAYVDAPVRIAHAQVTSQPSLIAKMVEALELQGDERVLEVGTGLGFQTALLSALCREVVSIELHRDLAAAARKNLASAGVDNVTVVVGDGSLGVPAHAPFDAIVTSAAAPIVPPALVEQLAEGGRLVHPLGPGGNERVIAWRKELGKLAFDHQVTLAYFVPMGGEYGARRAPTAP